MRRGFTLLELLVVIAVLAVVAVATVIALNPALLLGQARDAARISDMTTITRAIAAYRASRDVLTASSSVAYLSLPDDDPSCGSWDLPALPDGWTYACAPASAYRSTDGTGWIPIALTASSYGSPLQAWPVDPVNDAERFYAFVTASGTLEVTAFPESPKFLAGGTTDVTSRDGGQYPNILERGSGLGITPDLRVSD